MFRTDGEEVWLRDSSVLVLSEEGHRLEWQGVIEDITSERRAEQEIRASEARYRALVERVPAVVYEMGPDDERQTLFVSPHVEQVLGYTRDEWLDQPDIWIELLHVDDREVVLSQHDRHSETGEPWDLEYRLIANDGRVVWVHDRAILIGGLERGAAAWHGVMIDVTTEHDATEMLLLNKEDLERRVTERTNELQETNELMSLEIGERRRMEGELRTVEERYRQLVENLPGDRLRLGGASRRGPDVRVREPPHPGRPRILTRRMAGGCPRAPTRSDTRRRGPREERSHGRALPHGVSIPGQGRQRRLGPGPCNAWSHDPKRAIRRRSRV